MFFSHSYVECVALLPQVFPSHSRSSYSLPMTIALSADSDAAKPSQRDRDHRSPRSVRGLPVFFKAARGRVSLPFFSVLFFGSCACATALLMRRPVVKPIFCSYWVMALWFRAYADQASRACAMYMLALQYIIESFAQFFPRSLLYFAGII